MLLNGTASWLWRLIILLESLWVGALLTRFTWVASNFLSIQVRAQNCLRCDGWADLDTLKKARGAFLSDCALDHWQIALGLECDCLWVWLAFDHIDLVLGHHAWRDIWGALTLSWEVCYVIAEGLAWHQSLMVSKLLVGHWQTLAQSVAAAWGERT